MKTEITEIVDGLYGPSLESISRLRWSVVLLGGPISNETIDAIFRFQISSGKNMKIWAFYKKDDPVFVKELAPNSITAKEFHQISFDFFGVPLIFELDGFGIFYRNDDEAFILISGRDSFIKKLGFLNSPVLKKEFYEYAEERYPNVKKKFEKLWNLYVERSYIQ